MVVIKNISRVLVPHPSSGCHAREYTKLWNGWINTPNQLDLIRMIEPQPHKQMFAKISDPVSGNAFVSTNDSF